MCVRGIPVGQVGHAVGQAVESLASRLVAHLRDAAGLLQRGSPVAQLRFLECPLACKVMAMALAA